MITVLTIIYWVFLIKGLSHAYGKRVVNNPIACMTWIVFLSFGTSLLLSLFFKDGYISFLISTAIHYCLTTAYAYLLRVALPQNRRLPDFLLIPLTIAIPIAVMTIQFLYIVGYAERDNAALTVIRLQDLFIVLNCLLVYIPSNVFMAMYEKMTTMRVRYWAVVIYAIILLMRAIGELLVIDTYTIYKDFNLPIWIEYLSIGMIILVIIPHKWLLHLMYPIQIHQFYRLRKVQKRIFTILQKPVPNRNQVNMNLSGEIYHLVIAILDSNLLLSRMPDQESQKLHNDINTIIPAHPEYPDLVKALTQLPV